MRLLPRLLVPVAALAVLGSGPTAAGAADAVPPATPGAGAGPSSGAPAGPRAAAVAGAADPAAAEAAAAAVAAAQAELARLSAEVGQTSAQLTGGTMRLEEGRARLAETEAAAAQARAEAAAAAARAGAARERLGRFVNASYRTPRPDAMTLALSAARGDLGDLARTGAELDHVAGGQQAALAEATAAGETAAALSRDADALQSQAADQARELEAQVAALAAQAAEVRTRLEAAAERLRLAEAARQAAVDQAAAQAAAQKALVDATGGLALCTGASTDGYPNGFLPAEGLCPLAVGNGHRLRPDAAAAFNRLYAARPVCVTDSYRSYGAQVDVYARKPDLAAVPGTSNHGLGVAVDLCGGIESFGTEAYTWMQANAPRYGFLHPAWAEPGGSRPEPWHWEYVGG